MRIVRIIRQFPPAMIAGPTKHAYLLSIKLAERGHSSIIYTTSSGMTRGVKPERKEKLDGVIVKRYVPILEYGHLTITPSMISDLKREKADVIHVHGVRNFQTEVGAFISRLRDIPLVITLHGSLTSFIYISNSNLERVPNLLYDLLTQRFAIRQANCIVTSCKQELLEAVKFGVSKERVKVIPHGVEIPPYNASQRLKYKANKTLLYVGRINPKRNLKFLIRAFKLALEEIPELRLIIVGEELPRYRYVLSEIGYKLELVNLCKKLNIDDKVLFIGGLYDEKLWEVYSSCDLFVFTSKHENFGHVLVEAALFGKPIISTRVGVAPDLIGENEGGVLVDRDDALKLKNAVVTLLSDNTLYRRMQKAVLERVKTYSLDVMVDKYEKLYKELIFDEK